MAASSQRPGTHIPTASGRDASYDPRLNTEDHCRSFLQLLQDNDHDVRTAVKIARIRVDWHHAALKLNTGRGAPTRSGQKG